MRLLLSSIVTSSIALAVVLGVACNDVEVHPLDGEEEAGVADAAGDAAPPPPPVELGRHAIVITNTRKIVPSAGLPPGAPALNSNNNLDVVRFAGRVWLAWRTAPDHFASADTKMVLVSSEDETTWRLEKVFAKGTDLREPRWLVVGTSLFFYASELGVDPGKFEPKGILWSTRDHETFTELAPVKRAGDGDAAAAQSMTGYIAWRTKTVKGRPYMSAYLGGEHIYTFSGTPLDVELLTTEDGVTWSGANPIKPVVSRGGGSEMDFTFGDDGTLFAVIRNEAGDETGWGSKICRAAASDIATWTCKTDKKKYDSPLVFSYDGEVYLVGRRNVSETGNYDIGTRDNTNASTTLALQIDYRKHPKRCSLWRYVQGEDRIAFVLDLPSKGDTCFASAIAGASNDEIVLYNYSSDVDGPDVSWAEGQVGPTFVYRHALKFVRR